MPRFLAGAVCRGDASYDADIILLALGRVRETAAAIRSAASQTGVTTHVFVLDQGSTEAQRQELAAVAREYANVTLLAVDENLGVAGGRNLISAQGHGRIIVALDNDAEFADPGTVARMVGAIDAELSVGAIGCRIIRHEDGADDLTSWGYPAALLPRAGQIFDAVTFVGAGHAIRRTAWQQAGGYDAKLFFCWEEFDFCLRAIALGWRIRYRGDIVVRHKVSAEQRVGWTATRWFYFVRNRLYIERKLGTPWAALSPRILGYLAKGLRNGLAAQTAQAILAAAAMSPRGAREKLPRAAMSYLQRNDHAHRGSLLHRLMHEVLTRPPGAGASARR